MYDGKTRENKYESNFPFHTVQQSDNEHVAVK